LILITHRLLSRQNLAAGFWYAARTQLH